jgi:hypothetical protein
MVKSFSKFSQPGTAPILDASGFSGEALIKHALRLSVMAGLSFYASAGKP